MNIDDAISKIDMAGISRSFRNGYLYHIAWNYFEKISIDDTALALKISPRSVRAIYSNLKKLYGSP